jgi:hypothetical protein
MSAEDVGVVVLELAEVTSAEACYQFLHEEMGTRVFVVVEGLELQFFSLWLCLASSLRDMDDPDALLMELGHLAPIDERDRQGQGSDNVDEALSEAEGLETFGLGDAKG